METFTPYDKEDYYSGTTSITVNEKNAYELNGKFLGDLHNNAFSGTNGKDAVEHIEYYLKIIVTIKLPNVDHDKLRVVIFPILLVGGARRWFDRTKESITCWVDLTANFFRKYYPSSRIEPKPVKHTCKPFNYKTGCSEWPTCSWREDGYCNGGNFLGTYHVGKSLHYQDLEWYETLEDSELKDEALQNKAIIEGLIIDDESKDEYNELTITSDEACRAYQEIFRMMDEGWMVTRAE
nr:hypothetical protein [Tanacetum cinerariifolium]